MGVRTTSPRKTVYVDKTSKMSRKGLRNIRCTGYREKDITFATCHTRLEERSCRQRRMEASFERGQGPEGAVAANMMDGWIPTFVDIGHIDLRNINTECFTTLGHNCRR